jgi:hypothetical protein
MKQAQQCPKCGFQNSTDFKFCANCGGELNAVCPSCVGMISSAYKFCPHCGKVLHEESKPEIAADVSSEKSENPIELLEDIRAIGELKNGLPFNQQHWCDELGLHVWYRDLDRYTHGVDGVWVKAGGKYSTKIEGWTDLKKSWDVKKYKHGDWEALVKPTLDVARWLSDHGGLKIEDRDSFVKSIDLFKKSGKLNLPR